MCRFSNIALKPLCTPPKNAATLGGAVLRLAFYRGEKAFEHPLISPYITIGRGLDRDIRLLHPSISREHCAIRQRGESWELVETSSGGTRLNNTHIRDQVVSLSEGDTLTIGDFTIIVESAPDELPLTRPVAPRLHEALVSQAGSLTAPQAHSATPADPGCLCRAFWRSSRSLSCPALAWLSALLLHMLQTAPQASSATPADPGWLCRAPWICARVLSSRLSIARVSCSLRMSFLSSGF